MLLTTDGLIIKELKSGEDDRLITILTRDNGLIRVYAKNARKMKIAAALPQAYYVIPGLLYSVTGINTY